MRSHAIVTSAAPSPLEGAPYSQGVRYGQLVFTAGQGPVDPSSGAVVDGDVAAQTDRVLDNLEAVLRAGGSDLGHVLKATVYLANLDDWAAMNAVYRARVQGVLPARTAVEARLPTGMLVEIEMIGYVAED